MREFTRVLRFLIENEKQVHFQVAAVVAVGVLAFQSGCAPTALGDGPRRVAVTKTTERVILPTYADLSKMTGELSSSLDDLADQPSSADLAALREQYLAVRAPLEESRAFSFGPADERHSLTQLDQAPVDGAKLDAELAADTELTVEHVASLGANKRGLHAIEYLLYSPEQDAADAALVDAGIDGARRRQFLSALGELVSKEAHALEHAWSPDGDDYFDLLTQPGGPDSAFANVQGAVDLLLNQLVIASENAERSKLGRPLGVDGGGVDPSRQESERSGASLLELRAAVRGIHNLYRGDRERDTDESLSHLVHSRSPSADVHTLAAFEAAEQALEAIPEPFTTALEQNNKRVEAAYEAMKELRRLLATEVIGSLGGSLKFSDNDGD
jgi:predicted lipoprotein